MLRDDNGNGGGRPSTPRNVLGERLEVCSISPMTGFFRDGCCDTGREDIGSHTVCAVMTAAFLEFSKSRGNDLSTPMPEFGFRGLKPGTVGACGHPVDRKRLRRARHLAWLCGYSRRRSELLLPRRSQTFRGRHRVTSRDGSLSLSRGSDMASSLPNFGGSCHPTDH
jgi:uncharacterized protein (DUF2237 family)